MTSAANNEATLVKYVEPVYPHKARVEGAEGWLDVFFLVTSDGSVINPRIAMGTLDSTFRRAALDAVAQWKYSPASNGAAPNRPMFVRVRFRLADSKHT
jgi:TonB family protein